jgi:sulfur-oxidizing protein SoxY
MAAWPTAAFEAKSIEDPLGAAMGGKQTAQSDDIKIKAPDIAENGAVVPVSIKTGMAGVESIALLSAGNDSPMVASFVLGAGGVADVSTRIKMAKTGDVVAVVKAGGKLYANRKSVKVTIGGCGG